MSKRRKGEWRRRYIHRRQPAAGCSPTLTPNLVLFTDNQDIVNLLRPYEDRRGGARPVLDDPPEGYQGSC